MAKPGEGIGRGGSEVFGQAPLVVQVEVETGPQHAGKPTCRPDARRGGEVDKAPPICGSTLSASLASIRGKEMKKAVPPTVLPVGGTARRCGPEGPSTVQA
ncbi:hypothetical protein GCM10025778_20100 [Paeniglutamicibacter antarcticus]|uniref:Uncharacterized protein n=1 Tax=Paeniglutamicibacter antarcticus TaxID=494023 RepID=A0ABP9TLQ4_9MICC